MGLGDLLRIASPSLGTVFAGPIRLEARSQLADELAALLRERNGFFALEGALHVFPDGATGSEQHNLSRWNAENNWRFYYDSLAEGLLFFAQDLFGGQFALRDHAVVTFDPETGSTKPFAATIDSWAAEILADPDFLTGASLAHAWQVQHGPFGLSERLVPKQPFVLGGDYAVDNLYSLEASEGMRLRGELATQLRDLPEGATVQYRVVG